MEREDISDYERERERRRERTYLTMREREKVEGGTKREDFW